MSHKVEKSESGRVTVTFDSPREFYIEWDNYDMPINGSWIIDEAIKSSGARSDDDFTHCYVRVSAIELVKWEEEEEEVSDEST
jgi:hypothetical protein